MSELTHINGDGSVIMVDVGGKPVTEREAAASAVLRMSKGTADVLKGGRLPKGDALACARVAGIMAAKETSRLIPLCHSVPLTSVSVDIEVKEDRAEITSRVRCSYKTGVEMEALTAASVAALTLYDMCKAVDKGMSVENVRLLEKRGGVRA